MLYKYYTIHFVCGKCGVILTRQTNTDGDLLYIHVRKQETLGYFPHLRSQLCAVCIKELIDYTCLYM